MVQKIKPFEKMNQQKIKEKLSYREKLRPPRKRPPSQRPLRQAADRAVLLIGAFCASRKGALTRRPLVGQFNKQGEQLT